MQAGAALKEGLPNPYALSKQQRYPQLESCYYLLQKDLQVVEYLMHHQLLRTSVIFIPLLLPFKHLE